MRKLLFVVLVGACTSNTDTPSTQVVGQAVYRDAATDASGQPQQPATPPPQSITVQMAVKGIGSIPQIDPRCATDPVGEFHAQYTSTARISSTDAYVAAFSQGMLSTPSGCAVPDLQVSAIVGVEIRGELQVTTENCQTYCAANARADGEAQCTTSTDQASCRAMAESTLSAQCQTKCTTQAHAIVAQISLGASAFGQEQLGADELEAAVLGDLSANLTFEHLEDVSGNKL